MELIEVFFKRSRWAVCPILVVRRDSLDEVEIVATGGV
jgi:hypothetical protein